VLLHFAIFTNAASTVGTAFRITVVGPWAFFPVLFNIHHSGFGFGRAGATQASLGYGAFPFSYFWLVCIQNVALFALLWILPSPGLW
jgi:hypothetical protein